MITLEQILISQSQMLKGQKVKLVRHKDSRVQYRDIIKDRDALLAYQCEQPKDVFKGCDYIISFIGLERKRSIFIGVFKVNDTTVKNGQYHYDLEPVTAFNDLVDRLVIDWGKNAIAWHQWYDKQSKEVIEILPRGYIGNFPGLLDFVLEYDELHSLINNPEANHDWRQHLSSVNGIYMILDSSTGMQYIGSANGKNGIWQRWSDYAANGHGGNKELISLQKKNSHHHRNFKFSVLQSLPSNITQRELSRLKTCIKKNWGQRYMD